MVDDESAIRRALRPPLVELGFQVAEASRGEEALQLLRAAAFDAVLLDVNMPGIGGIETLRRIRAFAPRLPILMLTVRDQEEEKVEALDLGADDYVTKPFSTRELIARIRAAMRRVKTPSPRRRRAHRDWGDSPGAGQAQRDQARPAGAPHPQGVRHSALPDEPRRPRGDLCQLLTAVWGADCREEVEYLRTFVRQLRKKIEDDPSNPVYLLTDVYVGYRFADAQMFQEETAVASGHAEHLEPPPGSTS